jgi:hypothetical protein
LLRSTYLGGSGDDEGYGVAVDLLERPHVAGTTASSDFPTANALYDTHAGGHDADFLKPFAEEKCLTLRKPPV